MKNNLTEGKKPFIIFAAALMAILIPAATSVSAAP
jgi:hypothetical protein